MIKSESGDERHHDTMAADSKSESEMRQQSRSFNKTTATVTSATAGTSSGPKPKTRLTRKMQQMTMSSVKRMQLKVTLERLIAEQDSSIRIVNPDKSTKSAVWDNNSFQLVYHNNIKQEFALCSECETLVTYKSCYGTGSLIRHSCFRKRKKMRKITESFSTTSENSHNNILAKRQSSSTIGNPTERNIHFLLETMIRANDPSIELVDGTLLDWRNYKLIYRNGEKQDFVYCMVCNSALSNKRKRYHKCYLENLDGHTRENNRFPIIPLTNLPFEHKQEVAKQQLCFMYKDLIPPKLIDGKGFQSLAQCLINIGATFGPMSVENVLIDTETLRNQQNLVVETIREEIRSVFHKYKMAFSCDIWHDSYAKRKCMTVSGHYIDDGFQLRKIVLGSRVFDQENPNPDDVECELHNILQIYMNHGVVEEVEKLLSRSILVATGNDELLNQGLKNFSTIECACTRINSIVKRLIEDPLLDVLKICEEVRDILEVIRHTKNSPKIINLLDQYERVNKNLLDRWEFIWKLLSVLKEDDIQQTIIELELSLPNYEPIYNILQPFQKASICLSTQSMPTISAVYIYRKKIEDTLALSYFNETPAIKTLKAKALVMVQNEFNVSDIEKIALFLDPRFKSLKVLNSDQKSTVIQMVKKLSFGDTTEESLSNVDIKTSIKSENKKKDLVKCEDTQTEYLIEYMDDNENESNSELFQYMNLKLSDIHSADIVKFWECRLDMPHLRQLAKEILCIPASSATAEMVFSEDAKRLAKRRLYMDSIDLDRILMIHGTSDFMI